MTRSDPRELRTTERELLMLQAARSSGWAGAPHADLVRNPGLTASAVLVLMANPTVRDDHRVTALSRCRLDDDLVGAVLAWREEAHRSLAITGLAQNTGLSRRWVVSLSHDPDPRVRANLRANPAAAFGDDLSARFTAERWPEQHPAHLAGTHPETTEVLGRTWEGSLAELLVAARSLGPDPD